MFGNCRTHCRKCGPIVVEKSGVSIENNLLYIRNLIDVKTKVKNDFTYIRVKSSLYSYIAILEARY